MSSEDVQRVASLDKLTDGAMGHRRQRPGRLPQLLVAQTYPDSEPPPWDLLAAGPFSGDCGLDLSLREDVTIRMGQSANVPCGVTVALPPGTFGYIVARSSTWTRHGLIVLPGVIDEGWRGELRTLVYKPYAFSIGGDPGSVQHETVHLTAGTRLAQLIVLPNLLRELEVIRVDADELPGSERGEQGFGSSGVGT